MDNLSVQERIDLFLERNRESISSCTQELVGRDRKKCLEALEFLSVLSVYPGGHGCALDCLAEWQKNLGRRYRLEPLLQLLRSSEDNSLTTKTLISLINCILIGAESLDQRIRLRNEFFGLNLLPLLEKIRSETDDVEVTQEIERFEQMKLSDEEQQLSGPEGVDLNSHLDIFYAIMRQVSGSPQETLFLNILQHLIQIDARESLSDQIWEATEKMVARIRLIESKEEAEKILRTPTSSQLMERLRSDASGRCHCNCHQKQSQTSVITGAPPPPAPPLVLAKTSPTVPPPPAPPLEKNLIENSTLDTSTKGKSFSELLSMKSKTLQAPDKRNSSTEANSPGKVLNGEGRAMPKLTENGALQNGVSELPHQALPLPRTKLKTFAWNKVSAKKVVESGENLWSKAANHFKNGFKVNFDQIDKLFCQNSEKQKKDSLNTPDTPMERKRIDQVNLLGPRKSLNVNIFLKQFRGGVDDLVSLVVQCNGGDVGLEKLKSLVKILPEMDEIETLNGYSGDSNRLGSAEKFFLSLIQVPNYRLRIESMLLKEEFASLSDSIKPSLSAVILAAQDLKQCRALQEVMFLVLMVGNYLNSGGYGGNAAGFRMTSLWKLVEIRANKPKMTLMHFVATEAENKDPKLLQFPYTLKYLEEASKLSLETIKSECGSLRQKTDRINGQVEMTTDQDVKEQMTSFLNYALQELISMEEDLKTVESLRVELGEFFCEDVGTFKLEECFKIFHSFSQRFIKAVEENKDRRVQEEKAELKKRLKEQHLAKQQSKYLADSTSGSSLSSKYAALNSSRDITLTTYLTPPPESPNAESNNNTNSPNNTKKLVEILENKSRSASMTKSSSGTNWDMVDAPVRRTSRRRGSHCLLNERERDTTPNGAPSFLSGTSTLPRTGTWRERVDQLMQDDEKTSRSEWDEPRDRNSLTLDLSGNTRKISSGNIDKPQEFNPIFARTRLAQRESARILSASDLRTSPQPPINSGNGSSSDEKSSGSNFLKVVGRRERDRDRRSQSLYGSNSGTLYRRASNADSSSSRADDLNELLSSLETEKKHHEIMTRGRKYRWRESEHPYANDEKSLATPKSSRTDIDEIVRHCEKTREEIDRMGVEDEQTIVEVSKGGFDGKLRSMRDSGIDDGIIQTQSPTEEPEEISAVSFTFTSKVESRAGEADDEATLVEVETGVFLKEPAASCVLPVPQRRREDSSDGEQWRSVTDVSGTDARSTSEESHAGSVGDKDEGFETESHSTVCSVDQVLLLQNQLEDQATENNSAQDHSVDKPDTSPATSSDQNGNKIKKQPAYLSGTRASTAKVPVGVSSAPKTQRNQNSAATRAAPIAPTNIQPRKFVKRFVNSISNGANKKAGESSTLEIGRTEKNNGGKNLASERSKPKTNEAKSKGSSTPKSAVRSRAAANRPAAKAGTTSSSSSQNASPTRTPNTSVSSIRKSMVSQGKEVGISHQSTSFRKGTEVRTSRSTLSGVPSQRLTMGESVYRQKLRTTAKQGIASSDNTETKEAKVNPNSNKPRKAPSNPSSAAASRMKTWERLLSPPKSRANTTSTPGISVSSNSSSIKTKPVGSRPLKSNGRMAGNGSQISSRSANTQTERKNGAFGSSTSDRFSKMWKN